MSDRPIIGATVGTPFNPNNLSGGGITEITEDTYIYDLEDGIYHIDYTSGATIYYDEGESDGLQDGLFWVNYSEEYGFYNFIAIGRDAVWDVGTFVGETKQIDGFWVATYYKPESSNNKARIINEKTNNNTFYPTVKLLVDYVQEQLKNVGGGSGVDLVTEFEGVDKEYEEGKVYNANAVNEVLTTYVEHLEEFATTDYVDDAIQGVGGSTKEEWEHICDVSVVEDAENPIFVISQDLGAEYKKLYIYIDKYSPNGLVNSGSDSYPIRVYGNYQNGNNIVAQFGQRSASDGWTKYTSAIECNSDLGQTIGWSSIGVDLHHKSISLGIKSSINKLIFFNNGATGGFRTFTINIYGVRA